MRYYLISKIILIIFLVVFIPIFISTNTINNNEIKELSLDSSTEEWIVKPILISQFIIRSSQFNSLFYPKETKINSISLNKPNIEDNINKMKKYDNNQIDILYLKYASLINEYNLSSEAPKTFSELIKMIDNFSLLASITNKQLVEKDTLEFFIDVFGNKYIDYKDPYDIFRYCSEKIYSYLSDNYSNSIPYFFTIPLIENRE